MMKIQHTCRSLFVGGETTRHIFIDDCVHSSLCFMSPIKNGFLLRIKWEEDDDDDGDVGIGDWIFDWCNSFVV